MVAFGLGLCAESARAEPASGSDLLLEAGANFRHTTPIDLAALGGSKEFGTGNDASPGALSFEVGGGLVLPVPLELRGSAWIGVGGLNLSRVERRYLGSEPQQIGSSLTVGAGASARYSPRVTPDLRLFAGPALDWKRMAASSPAGSAQVELVGLGFDTGARLRISTQSRAISGHLELVLGARRELPAALWVGQSRSAVLFRGIHGHADAIYSVTASIGYVISFDDAL